MGNDFTIKIGNSGSWRNVKYARMTRGAVVANAKAYPNNMIKWAVKGPGVPVCTQCLVVVDEHDTIDVAFLKDFLNSFLEEYA